MLTKTPLSNLASLVANNIRSLRSSAGISQEELGARVGMAQGQIQKIETGGQSLKIEVLEKIALALRVDFHDLVAASSSPPSRKIPLSGVVNFLEEHQRQGGITIEYPEHIVFETQRADLLAFWVWNDSMNVHVPKESTIIVDPSISEPKRLDGQLVVVLSEGQLFFGTWHEDVTVLCTHSQYSKNNMNYRCYRPKFGAQFLGRVISFTKTYGE
jgi:transcriptional regulator with XRE-family HTH domain